MSDYNVGKLTFDLDVDKTKFTAGLRASEIEAATSATKTKSKIKGIGDEAQKTGRSVDGLSRSFNKAAVSMAALAAGAVAFDFLKSSVNSASALNEAMGLSTRIFKENAEAIQDWARSGADNFALSTTAALKAATGFAGLFQNVGFTLDDSTRYSKQLVELAADMASAFDTDIADAIQAISAGLRGETEPLKRYNVFLNDFTLKERARQLSLYEGTGVLSQYAKAQAAFNIILEDTATIQGDLQRTADDPANATRRLQAEVENLRASIGEELLPTMKELLSTARDVVRWISENQEAVMRLVKTAALVGGLALAWKGVQKAAELAAAAQAIAATGGMKGKIVGAGSKAGLAATGAIAAGAAASMVTNGDVINFGSNLSSIEDDAQRTANALYGIISPGAFKSASNFAEGFMDIFIPVTRMLEAERSAVIEFDTALASLVAEGKTAEAERAFQRQVDAAATYGATIDEVRALFPLYTKATEDAATASKEEAEANSQAAQEAAKAALAEERLRRAREASKAATDKAKAALDEYRQAVSTSTSSILGSLDPFGLTPGSEGMASAEAQAARARQSLAEAEAELARVSRYHQAGSKTVADARAAVADATAALTEANSAADEARGMSQQQLLERSAATREYLRQQARDVKALRAAELSDNALNALLDLEKSSPGTMRRVVEEGISKPFVDQLNKDFEQRNSAAEAIARQLEEAKKVVAEKAAELGRVGVHAYHRSWMESLGFNPFGDNSPIDGVPESVRRRPQQQQDYQGLLPIPPGGTKNEYNINGEVRIESNNPEEVWEGIRRRTRIDALGGR